MEIFERIAAMHPLVIGAWCLLIIADGILIYQSVKQFQFYTAAQDWRRIEVSADAVDVQRVILSREGSPFETENFEAVFTYRYNVGGQDYEKQTVRPVASREEAQALKERARIAFLYNPHNPEETLEKQPGVLPLALTFGGLLVVNSIGVGLVRNLEGFFGGGGM
ncbi:hypothetical protein ACSHT0_01860 [Tepidicaulis sp. LMO-SS28]|uniref:hypothetical protein n=1 Tax=Tepidicaulis sp. LMO-SS28 TaxID=3447455 RepID=UPI003EDF2790